MSKRKRALEKQKRLNSPARRKKEAKRRYYASPQAQAKWEEKKERRQQSRQNQLMSKGVSPDCHLDLWEEPGTDKCIGCRLRCTFAK